MPAERRCEWPGCDGGGAFPAPKGRNRLREYLWFCLIHVREYNADWNYYDGMSQTEVEADIRADTVWQRPSWRLGSGGTARGRERVSDPFGFYHNGSDGAPRRVQSTAEEVALSVLQLSPPVTVAIVKTRYKELVKRYHPDATGGDKVAEEMFKRISEAYRTIMSGFTA
jgi:transposase